MAAPLSSFSVFYELAKNGKNSGRYKSIEKFKLFCFILHDPEKHESFHTYVEENLHKLDSRTRGGTMIWFTLVKPNDQFKQMVQSQQQQRGYLEEITAIQSSNDVGYNERATVFSITQDLGIAEESLPCIVVTNDFIDGNIAWFSTDERSLGENLTSLHTISELEDDENVINSIRNNKEFNSATRLKRNLAEILTDAYCFNLSTNSNYQDKKQANFIVHQKIENLILEAQNLKVHQKLETNGQINDLGEINQFEEFIVSTLNNLLARYEHLEVDSQLEKFKLCVEPKSFEFILTGEKVLNMFRNISGFDYSCAIVQFAKALENEINHSIIQLIRKSHNIRLPQFYCKYQPDQGKLQIGEAKVNLNQKDYQTNQWKPITLGNALWVTNEYLREQMLNIQNGNKTHEFFQNNSDLNQFQNKWQNIFELRNRASHSEILNFTLANSVKSDLNFLFDKKYLFELSRMKNYLKM